MARKIKLRDNSKAQTNTASCRYYIRLTSKFSVKLYDQKGERDDIVKKQRMACVHGIAPIALCKVNINGYYGYITEHADTITGLTFEEVDELKIKMRELKLCTGDIGRYWNSGLINNRPVSIDFDSVSVGNTILRNKKKK